MMFVIIVVVAIAVVVVVVIVVNTVSTAPYKKCVANVVPQGNTAISSYLHKTHDMHARLRDLPVPPRYPRGQSCFSR